MVIIPDKKDIHLYRPGVGIMLLNKNRHVFIGQRLDNPGAWQMPQGGIDEGEEPEIAVFREMEEEIGSKNAHILKVMAEWQYYNLPYKLSQRLWDGRYKGQRQKWIALEFLGQDSEINLSKHTHPEFSDWKWVTPDALLSYVVPFKRGVYERVFSEFKDLF